MHAKVDLSPVYNRTASIEFQDDNNTFGAGAMNNMTRYPIGIVHIAGTDFDVRGYAQLGLLDRGGSGMVQRLECIPLPNLAAAAIHLLMHNGDEYRVPAGEKLAELTLHYDDGVQSEPIPLRAGLELQGSDDDSLAPFAFATEYVLVRLGGPARILTAPRLENPRPEHPIACMDLQWLSRAGSTLELPCAPAWICWPSPLPDGRRRSR